MVEHRVVRVLRPSVVTGTGKEGGIFSPLTPQRNHGECGCMPQGQAESQAWICVDKTAGLAPPPPVQPEVILSAANKPRYIQSACTRDSTRERPRRA